MIEGGLYPLGGLVAFGVDVGAVRGPVGGGERHVLDEGGEQITRP
jgi:hypothetical protein